MRLRDLQQILERFTNGQKGTMISDCPVYIETQTGHLEDLRKIEVQESVIVGDANPARLVFKPDEIPIEHEDIFGEYFVFCIPGTDTVSK